VQRINLIISLPKIYQFFRMVTNWSPTQKTRKICKQENLDISTFVGIIKTGQGENYPPCPEGYPIQVNSIILLLYLYVKVFNFLIMINLDGK